MRIMMIVSLVAALSGAGIAYAADDSIDKAAKKTSDGFGNLLKGMGQEIKKSGVLDEPKDEKKDEKQASKQGSVNPKGSPK